MRKPVAVIDYVTIYKAIKKHVAEYGHIYVDQNGQFYDNKGNKIILVPEKVEGRIV